MQQQFIALPPFTKGSLRDLPKSAEVMYREQNVFISLTLVLKSTTDFIPDPLSLISAGKFFTRASQREKYSGRLVSGGDEGTNPVSLEMSKSCKRSSMLMSGCRLCQNSGF